MARRTHKPDRYFSLADFVHGAANPSRRAGPSLQDVYDAAIDALEHAGVPFVLHGALAMASYGYERATGDIDLLVPERAARAIRGAMAAIGAAERRRVPLGEQHLQFNLSGWILDFFREADFEGIAARAERREFGGRWVLVISRNDLIERKLARGSALDVSDVKRLLGGGEG